MRIYRLKKNWERLFYGWRYTSSYVNDIKEGQEIFYNEDWSIDSISIYSNNDQVKKTKYNEDGSIESVCNKDEPHLYTCTYYDENWEILEITSDNWWY
jgi:antitoxin component YwqK of YwqJK toxin-antitoxin module